MQNKDSFVKKKANESESQIINTQSSGQQQNISSQKHAQKVDQTLEFNSDGKMICQYLEEGPLKPNGSIHQANHFNLMTQGDKVEHVSYISTISDNQLPDIENKGFKSQNQDKHKSIGPRVEKRRQPSTFSRDIEIQKRGLEPLNENREILGDIQSVVSIPNTQTQKENKRSPSRTIHSARGDLNQTKNTLHVKNYSALTTDGEKRRSPRMSHIPSTQHLKTNVSIGALITSKKKVGVQRGYKSPEFPGSTKADDSINLTARSPNRQPAPRMIGCMSQRYNPPHQRPLKMARAAQKLQDSTTREISITDISPNQFRNGNGVSKNTTKVQNTSHINQRQLKKQSSAKSFDQAYQLKAAQIIKKGLKGKGDVQTLLVSDRSLKKYAHNKSKSRLNESSSITRKSDVFMRLYKAGEQQLKQREDDFKKMREKRQDDPECTFKPQRLAKNYQSDSNALSKRTFDQFYEDQQAYESKKNTKISVAITTRMKSEEKQLLRRSKSKDCIEQVIERLYKTNKSTHKKDSHSIQRDTSTPYHPQINENSRRIASTHRTSNIVDILFYKDAEERKEKSQIRAMRHNESIESTMKTNWTASDKSDRVIALKLENDFNDIDLNLQLPEMLDWEQTSQVLHMLGFIKSHDEHKMIQQFWDTLKLHPQAELIHKRNVKVLLLGSLNLYLREIILPENAKIIDKENLETENEEENRSKIFQEPTKNDFGIFVDENSEFLFYFRSRYDILCAHKHFQLFYQNRVQFIEEQKKKFREAKEMEKEAELFKPKINEISEQLAVSHLNEIQDECDRQNIQLTYPDLLIKKGELYKEKVEYMKEIIQDEKLKECTFKPKINKENSQDISRFTELISHNTSRSPVCCIHDQLYSLARKQSRDRPRDEIEFERNKDQLTFQPDLSKSSNTYLKNKHNEIAPTQGRSSRSKMMIKDISPLSRKRSPLQNANKAIANQRTINTSKSPKGRVYVEDLSNNITPKSHCSPIPFVTPDRLWSDLVQEAPPSYRQQTKASKAKDVKATQSKFKPCGRLIKKKDKSADKDPAMIIQKIIEEEESKEMEKQFNEKYLIEKQNSSMFNSKKNSQLTMGAESICNIGTAQFNSVDHCTSQSSYIESPDIKPKKAQQLSIKKLSPTHLINLEQIPEQVTLEDIPMSAQQTFHLEDNESSAAANTIQGSSARIPQPFKLENSSTASLKQSIPAQFDISQIPKLPNLANLNENIAPVHIIRTHQTIENQDEGIFSSPPYETNEPLSPKLSTSNFPNQVSQFTVSDECIEDHVIQEITFNKENLIETQQLLNQQQQQQQPIGSEEQGEKNDDAMEEHEQEQEIVQEEEGEEDEEQVPLLFLDVNLGAGNMSRIVIYEGDDPHQVGNAFCEQHSKFRWSYLLELSDNKRKKLISVIDQQLQGMLEQINEEAEGANTEDEM